MPSGRTHFALELALLPAIVALALWLNHLTGYYSLDEITPPSVAFVLAYLFSSLFLSPDMDLARSGPQNRWRCLRVLWLPYVALFRHRGMSHNPILGPPTRVAYLAGIVGTVVYGLHYGLGWKLTFPDHWWTDLRALPLWAIGIGLLLPNEVHILADKVFSRSGGR